MNNIIWLDLNLLIKSNTIDIKIIKDEYLELMRLLTIVNDLSCEEFINQIKHISTMGVILIGYIIDDNFKIKIIASGTIIIEPKIIRGAKNAAHIEDIVIHNEYRSNGLSKILLNKLKLYAKDNNCYKIILDCDEAVAKVYSSAGFTSKQIQMSLYID